MNINTILSSSLLVALIAGLVAIRTGERKILIENVTQERAKWREKIRDLSLQVYNASCEDNEAKLKELILQFSLRLNPNDNEDKSILDIIHELSITPNKYEIQEEFRERVSLLLKHDWERAKKEARSWLCKSMPGRLKYRDFKNVIKVKSTEKNSNNNFTFPSFVGCMLASGGIFYIVSVFKGPFINHVIKYNNEFHTLTFSDHLLFIFLSLVVGLIWTPLYLWFKGSEKTFLEKWKKNNG